MTEIEQLKIEVFYQMSRLKFGKIVDALIQNYSLLHNVDVIFINKDNHNMAMERFRNEFIVKHGSFDTPFENDCIFLLNTKNVYRQISGNKVKVKYFFDLNLDTQIVSYLDKIIEGKELDEKKTEVANLFLRKRNVMSTVSISPYIEENTLFQTGLSEYVKRSIHNFFGIIYENHARNKKAARKQADEQVNRIIEFHTRSNEDPVFWVARRMYYIIYASFLKMYLVQINMKGYKSKVLEFMRFMTDDLQKVSQAEMILALTFFKNGQKMRFFGKYQKGNTCIIKDIKNTAWDIFHLRSLEYVMLFHKHKKADLTIPFFYSVDNRLNEVRKLIKLNMIILDNDTKNYYPFYSNDILNSTIKEFHLENKFTLDQSRYRYDNFSVVATDNLIRDMEEEIAALI